MGRRGALTGFGGLLAGLLAAVLLAVSAHAAPGAPACSGGLCTVTFAETGAAQTWTVPAGVTSATFTVDGAAGGNGTAPGGGTPALGGGGAEVQATLGLGSVPAVTLLIGGGGLIGNSDGVGGFNGGGAAGSSVGGGGGGGFSSVAFGSTIELLAGGGGGGGGPGADYETAIGGAGGAGGETGSAGTAGDSGNDGRVLGGGGGGQPGGASGTGGLAGALGSGTSTCEGGTLAGTSGSPASGSTGGAGAAAQAPAAFTASGGGGGGGEVGGGGGGSGAGDSCSASGGGAGAGGGSSYAAPGAVATFTTGVQAGNGQVTIAYSDPITAAPESYTVAAGQTLTVPAPGLLSGASGPSGDPLIDQVVSGPSHGTVETRPQSSAPPAIAGTAKAGGTLVCSPGTWANAPTAYVYQWSRDGTPISGATGSSHTVQKIDEGNTLSCAVAAVNVAGVGFAAASAGVLVPVPHVARCPAATGKISGTRSRESGLGRPSLAPRRR